MTQTGLNSGSVSGRIGTVAGLLLAVFGSSAIQARPVAYEFVAYVTNVSEYTALTNSSQAVNQSSFLGPLVSYGDSIFGAVAYDTAVPLLSYYQPPQPANGSETIYDSTAPQEMLEFIAPNGLYYKSTATPWIVIFDHDSDTNNGDLFFLHSTANDQYSLKSSTLFLYDASGKALQSTQVPGTLRLADFTYGGLLSSWTNKSDGNRLNVTAIFHSLSYRPGSGENSEAMPIPEPATSTLMVLSLGAVAWVARRRKLA